MGLYLGIFLVTLSGLMFEIGLTRIFSATIWYHYAFVAISVALLGWGLGGFALHLLRGRHRCSRASAPALLTLLYGALDPARAVADRARAVPPRPAARLLRGLAAAVPARGRGALDAVRRRARARRAALLRRPRRRLARGARRDVPALVARRRERRAGRGARAARRGGGVLAPRCACRPRSLAVLVLAALGAQRARPASSRSAPRRPRASTGTWRRLRARRSRSPAGTPTRGSTPSRASSPRTWPGSTSTPTPGPTSCPGTATSRASRAKREWYRALPFQVAPERAKTLVIGPGGGSDVLVALGAGSETVTAVEMNPLMLRFVRHFGAAGGQHLRPPAGRGRPLRGPHLHPAQRPRVRRDPDGLRRLVGGRGLGGLSLSENHLYTVEAFRAYLDHLSDDGQLVILRWPVDVPRLVSNAVALLGPQEAGERRRGAVREAPGRPRGPAADDLHAQEAALDRGRDRAHGVAGARRSR